jgi:hypothetical protein
MNDTRKILPALWLLAIVVTRIPFLHTGYGSDGDAWRVAHVGSNLWTSGVYEMSRPPGYPAHEILSAPLVGIGGSALSNAATLAASLIAVIVWHSLVQGRTKRPATLTFAFAFTPLFWVNSATTMDYVWSMLMILLAMNAGLRMKPLSAGVWAGLALGFRPTNGVLLIPLASLLLAEISRHGRTSPSALSPLNERRNAGVKFLGGCVLTTLIVFLPVFLTYGIPGWLVQVSRQFDVNAMSLAERLLTGAYRAVYAIGPLAFIGAVWIIAKPAAWTSAWVTRDPLFLSSLVAVSVLTLAFAFFPLEKSYLLSAFPFLLLILDRLATPRAISLFALLLTSFAFLNPDVVTHGGAKGTPGFNVHKGIVLEELQKRQELNEWRSRLASITVPDRTVIMTGAGPAFWFENDAVEPAGRPFVRDVNDVVVQRKGNPLVLFVPMVPRGEAERLEKLGWRVLCDEKNREYIERTTGYHAEGAAPPS